MINDMESKQDRPILPDGWQYASCLRCAYGSAYSGRYCPELESPVAPGDHAGCFCSEEEIRMGQALSLLLFQVNGTEYMLYHAGIPTPGYRERIQMAFGYDADTAAGWSWLADTAVDASSWLDDAEEEGARA